MHETESGRQILFHSPDRAETMELRLVLDAAGIPSRVDHDRGRWLLIVEGSDSPSARAELDAYRRENLSRSTSVLEKTIPREGAGWGVVLYAIVITSFSIATLPWGLGWDLFTPGQMQAGEVMSGQIWRTATALTLHLDEGHLASNLLFGVLFGFLAGRSLGGGIAWLSIVIAGSLGNLANAMVQAPEHTSIGASTAVFAALGILVADALRQKRAARESRLSRWSPIVGGVMLLSLIGVGGGRTDVTAHVTGFLAGLAIGWASSRLPASWLDDPRMQWIAALGTLGGLMIAWLFALAAS